MREPGAVQPKKERGRLVRSGNRAPSGSKPAQQIWRRSGS
jgi:hypothetical protein